MFVECCAYVWCFAVVVFGLIVVVYVLSSGVRCGMLFVVGYCSLLIVCCVSCVVRCSLFVVRCVLYVVCSLLLVVRICVVCYSLCFVLCFSFAK